MLLKVHKRTGVYKKEKKMKLVCTLKREYNCNQKKKKKLPCLNFQSSSMEA